MVFAVLAALTLQLWWDCAPVRAQSDQNSLRCRSDLVILGDSKYRVLAKCGSPDMRDFIGTSYLSGFPAGEYRDVEEWVYNMGPTDFIYTLRFEGGNLVQIQRGSRGFSVLK